MREKRVCPTFHLFSSLSTEDGPECHKEPRLTLSPLSAISCL